MRSAAQLTALAAVTMGLFVNIPVAHGVTDYGETAGQVARRGDCKSVRNRTEGEIYFTAAVCDLRGKRVNVITFVSRGQETRWLRMACRDLPRQWVMSTPGFVVTARDGSRPAAKVAQRVYGGDASRCGTLP